MENQRRQVVVLGAGFGGLTFCQTFHHPVAEVTVVDRQNHHLFQPLLYQVATAGLSAPEIAQPIRSILSDRRDLTVLMDTVQEIDLENRQIVMEKARLNYDFLILALGGVTSYFGHPEWETFAPGLKSLRDALHIRGQLLLAFEKAENETDPAIKEKLMTMVVVGGGPTGVELAGSFAELARNVLACDFKRIDPQKARIILIEMGPVLLPQMDPELGEDAAEQLRSKGVIVRTSSKVKKITHQKLELENGELIEADTIVWAAGVGAVPLTRKLPVEVDKAGRIKVQPDLTIPGHPEVFVIGDMASVKDARGGKVPGVSPAAMQMGRYVARLIQEELSFPGQAAREPFKYLDKGTMATIGRAAAVAQFGNFKISGFPAWIAWLLVHLVFLIGFRNKLAVLLQWAYSYFAYKRGARIITPLPPPPQ